MDSWAPGCLVGMHNGAKTSGHPMWGELGRLPEYRSYQNGFNDSDVVNCQYPCEKIGCVEYCGSVHNG